MLVLYSIRYNHRLFIDYIYIERERERVITVKKTTYLDEKYFRLTSLSIHFIYICLKTVKTHIYITVIHTHIYIYTHTQFESIFRNLQWGKHFGSSRLSFCIFPKKLRIAKIRYFMNFQSYSFN